MLKIFFVSPHRCPTPTKENKSLCGNPDAICVNRALINPLYRYCCTYYTVIFNVDFSTYIGRLLTLSTKMTSRLSFAKYAQKFFYSVIWMRERHVLEIILILRTNFFMNVIFHHRLVVSVQDTTLRRRRALVENSREKNNHSSSTPRVQHVRTRGRGEKEEGKKSLFRISMCVHLLLSGQMSSWTYPPSSCSKKTHPGFTQKDEIKMQWKALTYVDAGPF